MLITRRSLLALAAATAGAGALAMTTSTSTRASGDRPARKLVLVELQGGNDGLNTVIPLAELSRYRKLRPTIAIDDSVRIADGVGLHPSLAPLAKVFERGELVVMQGVGYANPVRSHFRSADIWHTGSSARDTRTDGWVARVLAAKGARGLVVGGDAGPLDGPGFAALAADGDKTARRIERPASFLGLLSCHQSAACDPPSRVGGWRVCRTKNGSHPGPCHLNC